MTTKTTTNPIPGQVTARFSLRGLRQKLAARWRLRTEQAGYRQMLDLEPHLLKDIGLSRADVVWALHQRADVDVGAELHSVRRRAV